MTTCASRGTRLPEDARFCPGCGAPVEAALRPSEERKLATVLFADLVGSTELGEQGPERTGRSSIAPTTRWRPRSRARAERWRSSPATP